MHSFVGGPQSARRDAGSEERDGGSFPGPGWWSHRDGTVACMLSRQLHVVPRCCTRLFFTLDSQ